MNFLQGYRTYITAAALAIVGVLRSQHLLDDASFQALLAVLVGTGFAALRHGVTTEADRAAGFQMDH